MPCDAEDMVVFEEWMKVRNKSYETEDEKLKRFQVFKGVLREAETQFPEREHPIWEYMTIFADITDEEFFPAYAGLEPESENEDDRNGVYEWSLDEKYMTDLVEGMVFGDSEEEEEEGPVGVKCKGQCCCITAPAAAADNEKEDVTAPVKPEPKH